jgi:hypothetical protein
MTRLDNTDPDTLKTAHDHWWISFGRSGSITSGAPNIHLAEGKADVPLVPDTPQFSHPIGSNFFVRNGLLHVACGGAGPVSLAGLRGPRLASGQATTGLISAPGLKSGLAGDISLEDDDEDTSNLGFYRPRISSLPRPTDAVCLSTLSVFVWVYSP